MTSNMIGTFAVMYEGRREIVNRAKDLKESVAMHREIYRLIRADRADEDRAAMSEHLALAQQAFASERKLGITLNDAVELIGLGEYSAADPRQYAPSGVNLNLIRPS